MVKQRILVTGAAGKVGQVIRPHLRKLYSVRLCDVRDVGELFVGEELMQGDLADSAFTERCVAGVTGVVHLAGLVAPAVSFEDTLGPNYRAMLALLEGCRRQSVERFVFASTHHVLGLHPLAPLEEGAHLAPDGFYALSKVFGEAALALYSHRFGIRSLVIRIGNVDPTVTDMRRERMWISAYDLAELIRIGLDRDDCGFEIVYGTSNCTEPVFPTERAFQLGYRPVDHAATHRAANLEPYDSAQGSGGQMIGGGFAINVLPSPFSRT